MGLKMLSNRLDSTRIERLVTVDVTRHTESQPMTSRVDPCESRRFVNIEYPNLTLEYVMSSFANRPPVRRIDFFFFLNNFYLQDDHLHYLQY